MWYEDEHKKTCISRCKYNLWRSQKPVKLFSTGAEGISTAFEATNFMSKDWFKNFKKHFNLHKVKLIDKEA